MENRLPLQAADLFRWHLQRRHQGTADCKDQKNLLRLGETYGTEEVYDEGRLEGLSESLLQEVRKIVEASPGNVWTAESKKIGSRVR
jgi:hypothetical protein